MHRASRHLSAPPVVQCEGKNAERLTPDVVADRGYFNSAETLACDEAGITVTLPKPLTSDSKAKGR